MGICQEKICIVDVLKEHAVEIDCLKFKIRKIDCPVSNITKNNLLLSKPNV